MAIPCQACEKNSACVHLTDIRPSGEAVERHLCESCAMKEGVAVKPHTMSATVLEEFIKQGLGLKSLAERVCPQCGASFKDFHEQGLLGCPYDYTAFADLLKPIIEKAQEGAARHTGKTPGPSDESARRQTTLSRLQRSLKQAVETEQYEAAARLRDEIRILEER
ncbi:MAG: Protein-arginine kinase activator protein [Phycisphaerae bacterium]|nr:Protein-arginine kinase activator protein [Phycisphaerae bacterium]